MKARSYTTLTRNGHFTIYSFRPGTCILNVSLTSGNQDSSNSQLSVWLNNKELEELHEQIGNFLRLKLK